MPLRYDTAVLAGVEHTPGGAIRAPANLTRVGVFPYRLADGSVRRELRLPEEVFSSGSLATLRGATVTDLHPSKDGERVTVTPENWKDYAVGHVADDVQPSGVYVSASVVIQDQRMIRLVEQEERREVSCGYSCKLEPVSGVWDQTGEEYDAIQREIVYNHVAIGPRNWGRAGPTVALRLDEGDAIQVPREIRTVEKETIDGIEYVIGSKEWATALRKSRDAAQGRADAAEKTVKDAKDKDAKDAKDRADSKSQEQFQAAVARRTKLLIACARVANVKRLNFDAEAAAGSSEQDLIVKAIKLMDPGFDVTGKSADYLMGAFEMMLKSTLGSGTPAAAAGSGDAMGEEQDTVPPEQDPEKKTDTRDIFSARAGTKTPGKVSGAPNKDDREDCAAAYQEQVTTSFQRGKAPLAFTKEGK